MKDACICSIVHAEAEGDVCRLLIDDIPLRLPLYRVVRWRSLREECTQPHSEDLRACLGSEEGAANAALYLLLRAVDRFHAAHNRFPGTFDG